MFTGTIRETLKQPGGPVVPADQAVDGPGPVGLGTFLATRGMVSVVRYFRRNVPHSSEWGCDRSGFVTVRTD